LSRIMALWFKFVPRAAGTILISCCIEYEPRAGNSLQTGRAELWSWNEWASGEQALGELDINWGEPLQ
jgi:hypothetical protein